MIIRVYERDFFLCLEVAGSAVERTGQALPVLAALELTLDSRFALDALTFEIHHHTLLASISASFNTLPLVEDVANFARCTLDDIVNSV